MGVGREGWASENAGAAKWKEKRTVSTPIKGNGAIAAANIELLAWKSRTSKSLLTFSPSRTPLLFPV